MECVSSFKQKRTEQNECVSRGKVERANERARADSAVSILLLFLLSLFSADYFQTSSAHMSSRTQLHDVMNASASLIMRKKGKETYITKENPAAPRS